MKNIALIDRKRRALASRQVVPSWADRFTLLITEAVWRDGLEAGIQ